MSSSEAGGGEDALLAYLSQEKVQSQYRLKSMMLFCQSIQSGSAVVNESLEILRQNAESDYDTILHLLTLLRHNNKSPKEAASSGGSSATTSVANKSSSSSPPLLPKEEPHQSSIQNEFFLEDPLTEGFIRSPSCNNFTPDPIPEDDEFSELEDKENEGGECGIGRRFIRPKEEDMHFARSLPVNVPLNRKDFLKNRFEPPEEDIPEDLEKGIAFIMSLKEKPFDMSDPRFRFKAD